MAHIDCFVDTKPMAAEINTVSNHIKGTTTAVAAMQAAVITAEEKAAELVCTSVNKGFFTMIRSQISQKTAKLKSEIDSHLLQLKLQQNQLSAFKRRMERDYNMISNRYMKLFSELNSTLKQRIFELDKPIVDFAEREAEKESNRTKYLTATVPVMQLESLAISQKIIASNLKFRGWKVIGSMTNFLSDMNEQKKLTDRILLSSGSNEPTTTLSIPVIICEYNFDKFNNKNIDIIVSNIQLNQAMQSAVKNAVIQNLHTMQWQRERKIDPELKNKFGKMLSDSDLPPRIKYMIRKLFLANNFQTVNNSAL